MTAAIGSTALTALALLAALPLGHAQAQQSGSRGAPIVTTTVLATSPNGQSQVRVRGGRLELSGTGKSNAVVAIIGHKGRVRAAAFSPDGTRVATAGDDGSARIWEGTTGRAIAALQGHDDAVTSVVFSPDGRTLATGSSDRTARFWDQASGREMTSFQGHTAAVTAVAFSPDGRIFATGSDDATTLLWDTTSVKKFAQLSSPRAVKTIAFTPDGRRIYAASIDGTLQNWSVPDGLLLGRSIVDGRIDRLHVDARGRNLVAILDDGKTITIPLEAVSAVPARPSPVAAPQPVVTAKAPAPPASVPAAQPAAAAPPPDAAATAPALGARDLLRLIPAWALVVFGMFAVALPYAGGGRARLLALAAFPLLLGFAARSAITTASRPLETHGSPIVHMAVSADGRHVATSDTRGRVWLRDLASGARVVDRAAPTGGQRVHALGFVPGADGQDEVFVIVGNDVESWTPSATNAASDWSRSIAPRSAGSPFAGPDPIVRAVVGSEGVIAILTCGASCKLHGVTSPVSRVTQPASSQVPNIELPVRPTVITLGSAIEGRIPDAFGLVDGRVISGMSGTRVVNNLHSGAVLSIIRSADGTVSLGRDGKIVFAEANTQTPSVFSAIDCPRCEFLAGSPDGRHVAAAGGETSVRVFDVAKWTQRLTLPHGAAVTAVALSDTMAVTSGADGTVRLWDLDTGAALGFARGHADQVTHAHITSDGRVVTASLDGQVRVTAIAGARTLAAVDPVVAVQNHVAPALLAASLKAVDVVARVAAIVRPAAVPPATATPGNSGGAPGPREFRVVPLVFATNRALDQSQGKPAFGTAAASALTLGAFDVTVPLARERGSLPRPTSWLGPIASAEDPARHVVIAKTSLLDNDAFLARMRARFAASGGRFPQQILVYVHGFNSTLEQAAMRAAQIARDIEFDGAMVVFSWPSAGQVTSYMADLERAQSAWPLLVPLFELLTSSGAQTINIIAHDMGVQPVLTALQARRQTNRSAGLRPIIRELVIAAPIMDRATFEIEVAGARDAVGGITLYASGSDRVVQVSRLFFGGQERAGGVGPNGPLVLPGVDTIDVTNATASALQLNHSIYVEGADLLSDLGLLLQNGMRPPDRRSPYLLSVANPRGTYWRYRK